MAEPDRRTGEETGRDGGEPPAIAPLRVVGFVVASLVVLVALPFTEADRDTSRALTAQLIVRDNLEALEEAVDQVDASGERATLRIDYRGPDDEQSPVTQELEQLDGVRFVEGDEATEAVDGTLVVEIDQDDEKVSASARLEPVRGDPTSAFEESHHEGRWTSILPPLFAVVVALFFRRLLIALGLAVWLGAALQTGFDPFSSLWMALETYLWGSVADAFSLYIIAFTFSLVGMVQVITRMGGMQGVLDLFARFAKTVRSTKVATALVGLAIFFDDYANTIVTGTTMRPMSDRRRISREKLAYIVDSTAAPIAGIAVISTWIGYEVGLFDTISEQLGMGMSGYEIFFEIILLRFYCTFAIAFVFLNAISGRDFGPMRRAEERADSTGEVLRPGSTPLTSSVLSDAGPADDVVADWKNAAAPVLSVILGTLLGMFWSGWSQTGAPEAIPSLGALLFEGEAWSTFFAAWAAAAPDLVSFEAWRDAFSGADNAKVLFWAALVGSAVAVVLATSRKLLSLRESLKSWLEAIPAMWLAVAILVLAWAIQAVCADLATGVYLVGAVQDLITPVMLPVLTFLVAAAIAFATGTSWGTMGILLPAIIPLAFYMTEGVDGGTIILMLCFGAVLDGAIYGDHCSPISDTTVMSSIATSVDHIDHVRTQFPYATTVMLAAAIAGYVGVALGLPVVAAHLVGVAALAGVLFTIGKSVRG